MFNRSQLASSAEQLGAAFPMPRPIHPHMGDNWSASNRLLLNAQEAFDHSATAIPSSPATTVVVMIAELGCVRELRRRLTAQRLQAQKLHTTASSSAGSTGFGLRYLRHFIYGNCRYPSRLC